MPKGPGKINVRYGEIYKEENYDRVVLACYQTVGFRREVNRQLKNGFGRKRAKVAQNYVDQAMDTIRHTFQRGLRRSGEIKGRGFHLGDVAYSYSFDDLAESTKKQKRRRLGAGRFWLDFGSAKPSKYGPSLTELVSAVPSPKVSYSTQIVGLDRRRGPDRIDFEMTIELSKMISPLDELVRRPLITGEVTEADEMNIDGGSGLNILSHLEFGFIHYQAGEVEGRPWISGFSAQVGTVMFDDLITNR